MADRKNAQGDLAAGVIYMRQLISEVQAARLMDGNEFKRRAHEIVEMIGDALIDIGGDVNSDSRPLARKAGTLADLRIFVAELDREYEAAIAMEDTPGRDAVLAALTRRIDAADRWEVPEDDADEIEFDELTEELSDLSEAIREARDFKSARIGAHALYR